jgi:hypothetical protein
LAYLRQQAAHADRAILIKVEGPDDTWKLPSTVQRQLNMLHERVSNDPRMRRYLPDLRGVIQVMLRQLDAQSVSVPIEDGHSPHCQITLGPYDLQLQLSVMLGTSESRAKIPRLVYAYAQGDWSQLAPSALENRSIPVQAMPLMMDCSSAASRERRERIEQERQDGANILGDAINAPFYPETCSACGNPDLGDRFRGPLQCDVPMLFVSGSLDVRTPPENVERIQDGFSRRASILVRNTGHDSRELMSSEFRHILQAFLRGEEVGSCELTLPFLLEPIESAERGTPKK